MFFFLFLFSPRPVSSGYLPENSSFRPAPWSEFLVACVSLRVVEAKATPAQSSAYVTLACPFARACFFFLAPRPLSAQPWHGPDFELHTLPTHARTPAHPRSAHLFAVTLGLQPRAATSDALAHCLGLQPSLAPSPVPAAAPRSAPPPNRLGSEPPSAVASALCPRASLTEPHPAHRSQPPAKQRYRFLPLPNPGQARLCHLLLSHPIILTRRPLSPSHLTRLILQRQGSVPADRSIRGRRHPNETTSARLQPIHRCRQHRFLSLVPLHLPGASTSNDSPIDIRLRASCFYVERLQRSNSLVYRLHRLIQLGRPASVFGSHVL